MTWQDTLYGPGGGTTPWSDPLTQGRRPASEPASEPAFERLVMGQPAPTGPRFGGPDQGGADSGEQGVGGRAQALMEAEALAALAPEALDLVARMIAHLQERGADDPPWVRDRAGLSAEADCLLGQVLGTGEVIGRVLEPGGPQVSVQESVLTGVWTLCRQDRDGRVTARWIEIATVPGVVADTRPSRTVADLDTKPPPGAFAVRALLTELADHAVNWTPGQPNHVLTLSLLPLTKVDVLHLGKTLGFGPVTLRVHGHGACLIQATGVDRIWSVRVLNASGTIVLDTLEVGGVPLAVRATAEDFAESAQLLGEIRDAYF